MAHPIDMDDETRSILLNKKVIAINQDPLGRQAYRVGQVGYAGLSAETWAKPLADGSIAVGLFNLGDRAPRLVSLAWEAIGLHDRRSCTVQDVWSGEELGEFAGEFSTYVDPHATALVRVTPRR